MMAIPVAVRFEGFSSKVECVGCKVTMPWVRVKKRGNPLFPLSGTAPEYPDPSTAFPPLAKSTSSGSSGVDFKRFVH